MESSGKNYYRQITGFLVFLFQNISLLRSSGNTGTEILKTEVKTTNTVITKFQNFVPITHPQYQNADFKKTMISYFRGISSTLHVDGAVVYYFLKSGYNIVCTLIHDSIFHSS